MSLYSFAESAPAASSINTTDIIPVLQSNTIKTATGANVASLVRTNMLFGASTATLGAEGNVNVQVSSAGVNPGATGADNVVAFYSIPASAFDVAGRGVELCAMGSFAANGNTKRVKIIFNPASATVGSTVGASGTTVADTGAVTTSGGGWCLTAMVFKYGAAASNTQIGLHQQAQTGGTVGTLLAPALITATESGAILVAVTGNATTTATDIVFNFLEVNAMN